MGMILKKPRVNYCWICGRKLQGDHHIEAPIKEWSGDDVPRILHKSCYKNFQKKKIEITYNAKNFEDESEKPECSFNCEEYGLQRNDCDICDFQIPF